MEVTVLYENKKTTVQIAEGSTAADLLSTLELRPDAHIILRQQKPIPVDCPLTAGEELKLLKVASGG